MSGSSDANQIHLIDNKTIWCLYKISDAFTLVRTALKADVISLVLYEVGVIVRNSSGVCWHSKRLTPCFMGEHSLSVEEPNAILSLFFLVIM
jgi:hypothetical protein